MNVNFFKNKDHKDIQSILQLNGFSQIINKPTRTTEYSRTLIDIICTTNKQVINKVDVIPTSISDNDMVDVVRKMNHFRQPSRTITCRNYTKYMPDNMRNDLKTIDWSGFFACTNINRSWDIFKSNLLAVFDKHAPTIQKRVKGSQSQWLSTDIKDVMNDRDKMLRRARKSKCEHDWASYRHFRNKCTNKVKKAKAARYQTLLGENSKNPRHFWKILKKLFPTKSTFFTKIGNVIKTKAIFLRDFTWSQPETYIRTTKERFKFSYVSVLFVQKELLSLKRNKSPGIDNLPPSLPPNLLKDGAREIAKPLWHLINQSLTESVVPTEWKHPKITPIHKSGTLENPDNYRPISVLPALSKILEKAVHQQLISYLEKHNLLSDKPFGYRKHKSTEFAVNLFVDDIRKSIDDGKLVGALFVDLSKAFDTISHSTLLAKLPTYGIHEVELDWFRDYLFNRHQQVFCEKERSNIFEVVCGVPQGSVLGPLLFTMFYNDLKDHLTSVKLIKFADDTVLYFSSDNFQIIENTLNLEIQNLYKYLAENELIINLKPGKTEAMLFGSSKRLAKNPKQLRLTYNGTDICFTKRYKYLGTIVDPSLNE